MFKRKCYDKLLEWKSASAGKSAGALRVARCDKRSLLLEA